MLLGDLAPDLTLPDGARTIDIRGITADSRAVRAGFLFAALPGTHADGARFAADAIAARRGRHPRRQDGAGIAAGGVLVLRADDPRHELALMAARFFPRQPEHLIAVTGTSGKTSVAEFTRQIFAAAGKNAASIGTLGIVTAAKHEYGTLTTPDPVALHAMLDRLASARALPTPPWKPPATASISAAWMVST